MKSLELTLSVLKEFGHSLGIDTTRDCFTVSRRFEQEGDGFLTITLPNLEKQLLSWLSSELAPSDLFIGFRRRGGLPAFLQGFLRELSDPRFVGTPITSTPTRRQAHVLQALRQVLTLHGKRAEACSDARHDLAVRQFIETDDALSTFHGVDPAVQRAFDRAFGPAIRRIERHLFANQFVGRHGPGAVSDKTSVNQRWSVSEWPHNLQRILPYWEVIPTLQLIDGMAPEIVSRPHSRLSSVPKTAKGPRLIAIEPWQHQFVQQGLLELLKKELSREPCWNEMAWNDQERNSRLAEAGSKDQSLSTLDLSEASDRVSLHLVDSLLAPYRYFRQWVMSCRSSHVRLPDGSLKELRKFASMGSALTFPLESMIFYAIARAGVRSGLPDRVVSVYGDDIIVPTEDVPNVIALLESHSFKVNRSKSFWTGWFRESCGSDWYGGYNVKVVKVRHPIEDTSSSTGVEKAVGLRNRLFASGLWSTAARLDDELAFVPFGPLHTPHLSRWTLDQEKIAWRFNPFLQRLEHKYLAIDRPLPADALNEHGALNKCLTMMEWSSDPLDIKHLARAGRPAPGRAKVRWAG